MARYISVFHRGGIDLSPLVVQPGNGIAVFHRGIGRRIGRVVSCRRDLGAPARKGVGEFRRGLLDRRIAVIGRNHAGLDARVCLQHSAVLVDPGHCEGDDGVHAPGGGQRNRTGLGRGDLRHLRIVQIPSFEGEPAPLSGQQRHRDAHRIGVGVGILAFLHTVVGDGKMLPVGEGKVGKMRHADIDVPCGSVVIVCIKLTQGRAVLCRHGHALMVSSDVCHARGQGFLHANHDQGGVILCHTEDLHIVGLRLITRFLADARQIRVVVPDDDREEGLVACDHVVCHLGAVGYVCGGVEDGILAPNHGQGDRLGGRAVLDRDQRRAGIAEAVVAPGIHIRIDGFDFAVLILVGRKAPGVYYLIRVAHLQIHGICQAIAGLTGQMLSCTDVVHRQQTVLVKDGRITGIQETVLRNRASLRNIILQCMGDHIFTAGKGGIHLCEMDKRLLLQYLLTVNCLQGDCAGLGAHDRIGAVIAHLHAVHFPAIEVIAFDFRGTDVELLAHGQRLLVCHSKLLAGAIVGVSDSQVDLLLTGLIHGHDLNHVVVRHGVPDRLLRCLHIRGIAVLVGKVPPQEGLAHFDRSWGIENRIPHPVGAGPKNLVVSVAENHQCGVVFVLMIRADCLDGGVIDQRKRVVRFGGDNIQGFVDPKQEILGWVRKGDKHGLAGVQGIGPCAGLRRSSVDAESGTRDRQAAPGVLVHVIHRNKVQIALDREGVLRIGAQAVFKGSVVRVIPAGETCVHSGVCENSDFLPGVEAAAAGHFADGAPIGAQPSSRQRYDAWGFLPTKSAVPLRRRFIISSFGVLEAASRLRLHGLRERGDRRQRNQHQQGQQRTDDPLSFNSHVHSSQSRIASK